MSEVFISCAQEDREMAEALVQDLRAKGIWASWDTELVGSAVIRAKLAKVKACIVIWTKDSVSSYSVVNQAGYSLVHNKLIATKGPMMDAKDIPAIYRDLHTEDIWNVDNIVRALEKLGVQGAMKGGRVV